MDIQWRTVQFFLDENNGDISEVQVDVDNAKKVRCSCTNFQLSAKCKHQKFVRKLMDENNGNFTIHIPEDMDDEEALAHIADANNFREFILTYGKVEVI